MSNGHRLRIPALHSIDDALRIACFVRLGLLASDNSLTLTTPYETASSGKEMKSDRWGRSDKVVKDVLRRLDEMNINAFSLLGTEESLMDPLAMRKIMFKKDRCIDSDKHHGA